MSSGISQRDDEDGALFRADEISKIYRTGEVEVHALRAVSLAIHTGELLVILGASGSGKSTLLNILGGLDVVSSGDVFYGDQELSRADEATLTRYRREHVRGVCLHINRKLDCSCAVDLVRFALVNGLLSYEAVERRSHC